MRRKYKNKATHAMHNPRTDHLAHSALRTGAALIVLLVLLVSTVSLAGANASGGRSWVTGVGCTNGINHASPYPSAGFAAANSHKESNFSCTTHESELRLTNGGVGYSGVFDINIDAYIQVNLPGGVSASNSRHFATNWGGGSNAAWVH